MIRDALREFSQQQLLPHAAAWDRERRFPREALQQLAQLGAFGIAVPEAQGGAGLDYLALAIVIEEIAAGDGGTSTIISVNNCPVCSIGMALFALFLRRRPPLNQVSVPTNGRPSNVSETPFGLTTNRAQTLLLVAGLACCVAMSMPQVHIVAYCVDLGFGPARGAEMLSLMLACGVVSRLISGVICVPKTMV